MRRGQRVMTTIDEGWKDGIWAHGRSGVVGVSRTAVSGTFYVDEMLCHYTLFFFFNLASVKDTYKYGKGAESSQVIRQSVATYTLMQWLPRHFHICTLSAMAYVRAV